MKPIYKTMELITINDQLTNIDFNENTSRNTTINNIELVKLDELDESLLHFGDIKVEKYSECLGVSRHISYNTKQYLAVKIGRVKAAFVLSNYLDIHDDSINFDLFQTKLKGCIKTSDVSELQLHLPGQVRYCGLEDVVGSNYVTYHDYGCSPYGILVNQQCTKVPKNVFF